VNKSWIKILIRLRLRIKHNKNIKSRFKSKNNISKYKGTLKIIIIKIMFKIKNFLSPKIYQS